ncbi:hypothetical protein SAMN04487894_105284 [Niabella drilacis]|uniref:Uncharacterized protein n=1 Tax=Niabella drilacis (strain DSM 25811 / CCM 8410 / CCUG 62505 / LMG 26954 / E90) TaxID=1285928 RepID=A0A1G6RJ67_NIADE|nr:hypothetical protein SAMN04487894_105284 [Niabella drilacis]
MNFAAVMVFCVRHVTGAFSGFTFLQRDLIGYNVKQQCLNSDTVIPGFQTKYLQEASYNPERVGSG